MKNQTVFRISAFVRDLFLILITAFVAQGVSSLADMSDDISGLRVEMAQRNGEINSSLATIIERMISHDRRITKLEK